MCIDTCDTEVMKVKILGEQYNRDDFFMKGDLLFRGCSFFFVFFHLFVNVCVSVCACATNTDLKILGFFLGFYRGEGGYYLSVLDTVWLFGG